MARTASMEETRPLSEINTTPLIDVMLVLLIMIVMTIPAATHSLDLPLPGKGQLPGEIRASNTLLLDPAGRILWNGSAVDLDGLSALLARAAGMPTPPELRFQPDAQASYALSVEVLRRIKLSGLESFGFVGNEQYAEFGKATGTAK